MGQNERTMKLTVDVVTKINNIGSQVEKIQKELEKIKGPDNLEDALKEQLDGLLRRYKNVKKYIENNELSFADEKKARSELTSIEKMFTSLFKKINSSSGKFELKNVGEGVRALEEAAKTYKAAINDSEQAVSKQEKQIDKLTAKLRSLQEVKKNADRAGNEVSSAIASYLGTKQQLGGRKEELEALLSQKRSEKLSSGRSEAQTDADLKRTSAYKELISINEELAKAHEKVTEAQNKHTQAIQLYNSEVEKVGKSEVGLGRELEEERNKLEVLQNALKEVSNIEFGKVVEKLKEIGNLGFDPEALKSYEDLEKKLKELSEEDGEKVVQVLNAIKEAAKNGGEGVNSLNKEIGDTSDRTKELDNTLENFKNKVKYFFGLENAVNLFKRGVSAAFETVKDLDAVMTETAVVTDFSVGDMWDQLPEYTERAKELGVSIHDAYEAATLYYQQGLSTNEVVAVSNETLKMARIAGLDAAEATDRMTNALRGFNMEITEANAQNINDVYSNLAAITASDVNEISVAMTKVASLANNANMSFENTAAFLSQIIETTRESAETAGTALKTVIARFSEVKELYSKGELLGTDEEGEEIDVNKVSKALRTAGINLNEYLTGAKGLDEIFIELSSKWGNLDQVQQRYIATMAAGSRQQSRFIALMQDDARMTELVSEANNSAGASQKQFEKTLDSLQTKLAQLKDAWDTFLMGLANNKVIKFVIDTLTKLLDTVNKLTANLSGFGKTVANLGIAFGGFKLARSGLNKVIGKAGESLFEVLGLQSKKSGEDVAENLTEGISEGLNQNKTTLAEKIKSFLTIPANNVFTDDLKDKFLELTEGLNTEETEKALEGFKTGGLKGANEALEETGHIIETTDEELNNFQGTLTKSTQNFGHWGIAITAAGGILSMLPGKLGEVGKAVTSVGGSIAAVSKIMSMLGKSMGGIGALASGALGLAAFGISKLIQHLRKNSPEEQLKKAEKSAESAAKGVEDASKRYDDLKNSLDGLKDANANIDKLTEGTTEWKNAVQDGNKQVLDLIENYKELAQYVKNEGGRLVLDTESTEVQAVLNRQQRAVTNAQAVDVFAQKEVAKIQGEIIASELRSELLSSIEVNGEFIQLDPKEVAKYLAGDIGTAADFSDRGITQEKVAEAVGDNLEIFREGGEELLKSTEHYYTQAAAFIENSKDFTEDELEYIDNYLSSNRIEAYEKQAIERDRYGSYSKEGLQTEIAKRLNYDTYADLVEAQGELTDAEIRDRLAWMDAFEDAGNAAGEFAKSLKGANGELLRSLYRKEGGLGLTQSQVEKLGGMTDDDIYTALTGKRLTGLSSEQLEEIRSSIEYNQLVGETKEAVKNAGEVFEKYFSSLPEEIKTNLENTDASTVKTFSEFFNNIADASGKEASENISNYLKDLNTGDLEKVAAALNMIDPRNIDEVEGLPNTLADLGGESIFAESEMQGFIKAIEAGAHSVKQFNIDNIIEQIRSIGQLQKDIRTGEHDRTFSEDEYNNLIKVAPEIAANFEKDLSGNYVYVGQRMENLTAALDENTKAVLEEANKQLDNQIKAAEALGKSSYLSYEGGTPHDVVSGLEDRASLQGQELKDVFQGYLDNLRASGVDLSMLLGIDQNSSAKTFSEEQIHGYLDQLFTIMNSYAENKAAQAKAEQEGKILFYQSTNTATQNAELGAGGDSAAVEALKVQAAQAGITQDAYAKLYAEIEAGGERANAAILELGRTISLLQEADGIGIDREEIDREAAALKTVNKELSNNEALQMAVLRLKFDKGVQKLTDSYEDWTKILDENNGILKASTIESGAVINDFKDSVNLLLDTSQPLSDSFFENAEYMADLRSYIEGDEEALERLRIAAAQDITLQFSAEAVTEESRAALNELSTMWGNIDLPDIEPGMNLNVISRGVDDFIALCSTMVSTGKVTMDQMNAIWNAAGFEGEWTTEEVDVPITGDFIGANGHVASIPSEVAALQKIGGLKIRAYAPRLKFKSLGSTTSSYKPPTNPTRGGSEGGSDTGKTESPKTWDNPYDELYNKIEEINEALRQRNYLEREYENIIKDSAKTNADIAKSYQARITNLKSEKELRESMAESRRGTVEKLNSMSAGWYRNSEGQIINFKDLTDSKNRHVNDFARYDVNNHRMEIQWNQINALAKSTNEKDIAFAEGLETYISELEKLSSSMEEELDAAAELQKTIDDLTLEMVKLARSFEDRVLNAIISAREKEIDKLENLSDTIKNASDKVIDDMRRQVEAERQARQNEKTEEEIAQKESRLEYLRRDTSGANQKEILQLEKELEESRQNYQDSLIDQSLKQMQDEADIAAEQRANQIKIMREQLEIDKENGTLWREAYDLINYSTKDGGVLDNNSKLVKLLEDTEGFKSLSELGKTEWMKQLVEEFHGAIAGYYAAGSFDKRNYIWAGEKPRYANGGLADFTGPAWLDGTKSNPELVLDPTSTKNFISLINTLNALNNSGQSSLGAGGNNYYDIDISAELGSDYDVDQLVKEIKRQIQNDSAYRNTTSIGFIR